MTTDRTRTAGENDVLTTGSWALTEPRWIGVDYAGDYLAEVRAEALEEAAYAIQQIGMEAHPMIAACNAIRAIKGVSAPPKVQGAAPTDGCRMQGGICACRSGGSYGGCVRERENCCAAVQPLPAAPAPTERASIAPMSESGRLKPGADKFVDLMRAWRFANVGAEAERTFNAVAAYVDQWHAALASQPVAALPTNDAAEKTPYCENGQHVYDADGCLFCDWKTPSVAALPAEQVPTELPLLPSIPTGDRFENEETFRYLGRGGNSNLYECWDDAIYKYAQDYAREAVAADRAALAARQAPTSYRWPHWRDWLASPISPPISSIDYAIMAFNAGRETVGAARQVVAPAYEAKDHEIRQLVNDLRDIAIQFRDTQQLRSRIQYAVLPFFEFRQAPARPVVDGAVERDAARPIGYIGDDAHEALADYTRDGLPNSIRLYNFADADRGVTVPVFADQRARSVTNAEVEAWIERNNLGGNLHLDDARTAIEDAASIHMTPLDSTTVVSQEKAS